MNKKNVDAKIERVPVSRGVASIIEIYQRDGAVIVQGLLTKDQVRELNAEMDIPLAKEKAGPRADEDPLAAAYYGAQTKRLTNIATHSRVFREEILDGDLFHEIGDAVFREEQGDWWLTTAQLIEIGPGNAVQPLHRDIDTYVGFVALGKNGPEVVLNQLIALTDFKEANGGTRVIIGSNHWDDFSVPGTQEMTIPVEMSAGDSLLFSGKLIHGGGANVTADEHRRALAIPLVPCYLTPGEAYPFLLGREMVDSLPHRVQKILAFHAMYPKGSDPVWSTIP